MRRDLRFDRRLVEIADGDDRHQIGPVPIGVELLQPVVTDVLDDLGLADRQPLRVARAGEEDGELRVLYPLVGAEPEPPFFQDDASFLVDRGRIEGDVVRPVLENEQRPVHHRGVVCRYLQLVHGLVETGMGVDVCPEPHAERLHEAGDRLLGEMQRAVEAHMLDEVSEPALIVVFENGARVDDEPKFGAGLRLLVRADVVAQAIGERADRDQRIDRHGLAERGLLNVHRGGGPLRLRAGNPDRHRERRDTNHQPCAGTKGHASIVGDPRRPVG